MILGLVIANYRIENMVGIFYLIELWLFFHLVYLREVK